MQILSERRGGKKKEGEDGGGRENLYWGGRMVRER